MSAALRSFQAPVALLLALAGCGPAAGPAAAPAPSYPAPKVVTMDQGLPDPVARIGDQAITLSDLEEKAAPAVAKANQQLYSARRATLDSMVNDQLTTAEATKRGISKEDLLKQEIDGKIAPVTDADVQKFYDENKARMPATQTFDSVKDKIRGHLAQTAKQTRQTEFLKSLKDAAHVEVYLAPPRIQVATDGFPRFGSATAPIQIVEFSDFQCPYCKKGADTVKDVESKYGDKVSIVFRNYPLPMHKYAHRAAEAGYCAGDQGKFWEFYDTMFSNQGKFEDDALVGYATTDGMDGDKFKACLTGDMHKADVDRDIKDGDKAGMSGTPGFYINGRMLEGAQPIEQFSQVIDEELASAGQAAAPAAPGDKPK